MSEQAIEGQPESSTTSGDKITPKKASHKGSGPKQIPISDDQMQQIVNSVSQRLEKSINNKISQELNAYDDDDDYEGTNPYLGFVESRDRYDRSRSQRYVDGLDPPETVGDWRKNFDDYEDDYYEDDDDEWKNYYNDDYYGDHSFGDDDQGAARGQGGSDQTTLQLYHSTPNKRPCSPSQNQPSSNKKPKKADTTPTPRKTPDGNPDNNDGEDEEEIDLEMAAIVAEYEDTKPRQLEDVTTDPIPQPLADTLKTWMWKHYNADEIKKLQEKARRPKNVDALIPLKIKEELFQAISPRGKIVDARYRYIQNALAKGCQPIAMVWAKIIQAFTALQRYRKDKNPFLMVTPDLSLDLNQLKAELDLGLRLLGTANLQLGLRRRLTLKSHLSPGFKRLCEQHLPISQFMFGGNIKAVIDDTTKINRMVADSQSYDQHRGRGRPFLGGRGRSFRGGSFRRGGRSGRRGSFRGFRGRGRGHNFQQNQQHGKGHSQKAPPQNN